MIDNLPDLPEPKRLLLQHLVDQLSVTKGISAIVLGGSYASGTHNEASDLDIGLYYYPESPFLIPDIQRIAAEASIDGQASVTDFYGWGPWVNGGAWIHTPQGKVDFIYRNVEQLQHTIIESKEGIYHHDYDQQPTYGFYSVIYLAETQICVPLYDPGSLIPKLKQSVEVYPPRLKQNLIADSLWSAEFTLLHARRFAAQADIYNTVGCLTRIVSNITQALFALNERYYMRDKKLFETISSFPTLPSGYLQQIDHVLAHPGSTAQELTKSVSDLEQAWRSALALPGVQYEPKFQI